MIIFMYIYIFFKYSTKSFTAIDHWLKDLKTNSNPDVKIFLVGNKNDLEDQRKVSIEEAKKLCEDLELDYFIESSAKTGFNAEKIFIHASKLLFQEYERLKKMENAIKIETNKKLEKINNKKEKKKKRWC